MGVHQLFLSLGGNLGHQTEIFLETRKRIQSTIGETRSISSLYRSAPWGFKSTRWFLNQVIQVETTLAPEAVLEETGRIEALFGRKRTPGKYLSRKMDIDILFYDDLVSRTEGLVIPHPLLHLRRFVLLPAAEIAPRLVHPGIRLTLAELLDRCPDRLEVFRIPDILNQEKSL